MAHGKFDATMEAENPLEVCGPIKWDGDEPYDLQAVVVEVLAVSVFQATRTGHGTSGPTTYGVTTTSDKREFPAPEWETHVTATTGTWQTGRAFAMAVVRITTAGRDPRWVFELWSEPLTLI